MTSSIPDAVTSDLSQPLKVVGYVPGSIAARESDSGIVDVRLQLSREPTEFEAEQTDGDGYVFGLATGSPFVQLVEVHVDKLPAWIEKVNAQLSVVESDAAYAERRVLATIEAAERVLKQVDFGS